MIAQLLARRHWCRYYRRASNLQEGVSTTPSESQEDLNVWPIHDAISDIRKPFNMSLDIQAMTQEKLSLTLPIMCTVGPDNDIPKLKKYCLLLSGDSKQDTDHVQNVIRGVIEGEIR